MSKDMWQPFSVEDLLSIRSFEDLNSIRFSPDGQLIVYTLEDRSEAKRKQLWICGADGGDATRILPEAMNAWRPSWSPSDRVLAFYADVGEGIQLWVWDAERHEARRVSPTLLTAGRFEIARWLPDERTIICKLANAAWLAAYHPSGEPIEPGDFAPSVPPDQPTVRCWESGLGSQSTGGLDSPAVRAYMSGTLARIDAVTGEVTPLADVRTHNWVVSPDGRSIAFLRFIGHIPSSNGALFDLCVLPSAGGEPVAVAEHLATREDNGPAFSWSPDSTMIAYWASAAVSVVSPADRTPRTLFGTVDETCAGGTFDPPLWAPDGSYLLSAEGYTIWRIPVAGESPVDLMPNRGSVMALDTILRSGGRTEAWAPDGTSILAFALDTEHSARVLVKVGLEGGGILAKSPDLRDASWAAQLAFRTDVSPADGRIIYVREDASHPEDIWYTDYSFSPPRQLTTINSHVHEGMFTVPQVLQWTTPDGCARESAFFPPAAHFGPPPWPTVFRIYEGPASENVFCFGCRESSDDNVHLLTSQGYAVCMPDVFVSADNPAQSIRESIACAVKATVDAGLADPKRLGVLGMSFGGYMVNLVVTALDCFAAAVTDVGRCNLTSAYGAQWNGDSAALYVEHCQTRMGVPPWENPQRYIENSPLFFLDRVTTPLLILFGSDDIDYTQGWEMFNGLRRLNKPAAIAVYEGEGHILQRRANIIDRWQRILAWFDRYLRPEGISDG